MNDTRDRKKEGGVYHCFGAVFTSKYAYRRSDDCVIVRLLLQVCFGYEFDLYQHYINPEFSHIYHIITGVNWHLDPNLSDDMLECQHLGPVCQSK